MLSLLRKIFGRSNDPKTCYCTKDLCIKPPIQCYNSINGFPQMLENATYCFTTTNETTGKVLDYGSIFSSTKVDPKNCIVKNGKKTCYYQRHDCNLPRKPISCNVLENSGP